MGAARPIMKRMADASRLEEGCLKYGYAEDVLDRGLIHVKEMWIDQDALDPPLCGGTTRRMASRLAEPWHR